jgi:hypothetical protein
METQNASLITTELLRRAIGVSTRTINNWRSHGVISPTIVMGATIRWRLDEVVCSLQKHRGVIPNRPNPNPSAKQVEGNR